MKKAYVLIAVLALALLIGCKEKKRPAPPKPKAQVVEVAKQEEPKAVAQEEPAQPVVKQENYKYFLVAGCFQFPANAERFHAQLRSEGYDSQILPYYYNMQLVTYKGFTSKQEALRALEQIRNEFGKEDSWVFISRPIR